jgi:hypothetical protein
MNTGKQPIREPIRDKVATPKLRPGEAVGRNGEVLRRNKNYDSDPFFIPEHLMEDGYTYQWNRASCYGKSDAELIRMMDNGWRYVPLESRIGKAIGNDGDKHNNYLERDGLVLMERPSSLTQEAIDERQKIAEAAVMAQYDRSPDMPLPPGFANAKREARKLAREVADPALKPSYKARMQHLPIDD